MPESGRRIVATVEARMRSTRLPGKVLKPIMGRPVLELLIERLKQIPALDDIIIATTDNPADSAIAEFASEREIKFFRGSEEDVLDRVLRAARAFGADLIVEMTGDCPLLDPDESQRVIEHFLKNRNRYDYVSNVLKRTYPRGLDTQIFPTGILDEVARKTTDPADRENVSLYIYEHPSEYRCGNVEAPDSLRDPQLRLTLDTPEDFELIRTVYEALYPTRPQFRTSEILHFLKMRPELRAMNLHIQQKKVRA